MRSSPQCTPVARGGEDSLDQRISDPRLRVFRCCPVFRYVFSHNDLGPFQLRSSFPLFCPIWCVMQHGGNTPRTWRDSGFSGKHLGQEL